MPSQFSHEILNANPYAYLDDAPLEERRARAVQMRRMLPEAVLNEVGRLDQQAIARVREEARPDVREADELHDALQTLVALPEEMPDEDWQRAVASWAPFLAELLEGWRVVRAVVPDDTAVRSDRLKPSFGPESNSDNAGLEADRVERGFSPASSAPLVSGEPASAGGTGGLKPDHKNKKD